MVLESKNVALHSITDKVSFEKLLSWLVSLLYEYLKKASKYFQGIFSCCYLYYLSALCCLEVNCFGIFLGFSSIQPVIMVESCVLSFLCFNLVQCFKTTKYFQHLKLTPNLRVKGNSYWSKVSNANKMLITQIILQVIHLKRSPSLWISEEKSRKRTRRRIKTYVWSV